MTWIAFQVSEIRSFHPRKSSTFLIPSSDESRANAQEYVDEDQDTIRETAHSDRIEECDEPEDTTSSVLMIRVMYDESDSSVAREDDSALSTPKLDRSRMIVPQRVILQFYLSMNFRVFDANLCRHGFPPHSAVITSFRLPQHVVRASPAEHPNNIHPCTS